MPSRRPITDARAYGKFGKHLRWKIIEAAYNYGSGVALIRAIRTVGNEHAGAYMRHAGYNVVEVLPGVFVDGE